MEKYISSKAVINEQKRFLGYLDNDMLNRLEVAVGRIPAADVVPREEYAKLQEENAKLKKKIREMKSDASWDEEIRRGQVQGMW